MSVSQYLVLVSDEGSAATVIADEATRLGEVLARIREAFPKLPLGLRSTAKGRDETAEPGYLCGVDHAVRAATHRLIAQLARREQAEQRRARDAVRRPR